MRSQSSSLSENASSLPFRLTRISLALASAALLSAGSLSAAHAADAPSVAELQAEIARLKQVIAQQNPAAATTAPSTPAATTTPAPKAAKAEDEAPVLGAVTVRSRNRIERLQDVPLSVSVVTGKELDRLQANDIGSIAKRVANVSWNQGNQRTSSISIRGIGKQGQTEAQDPSVGLIVDGVNFAYNALSSSFDFTDVEAVEVTRGPQGTLLGKSTSVGVINVQTRRPSFTPDASYSVTIGQNDTVIGRLAAGGPLIDDVLAWRGNLSVNKGAGDIKNAYNRDITYTNKDRVSGRVQFLLKPNKDLTARFALDAQPRGGETTNGRTFYKPTPTTFSNGSNNTLPTDNKTRLNRRWFTQDTSYSYDGNYLNGGGKNQVNNDYQRPLVTGSNGALAEVTYNLPKHTITSITAYKDYHFNAVNDEGTPFDVHRNSGGFWNDYHQVSQELRLTSKPGGFVDYQAGLFFLDVNNSAEYQKTWGNDAGAWFANADQYKNLDKDGAGRYLLQNSLAGLNMAFNSPAGLQKIHNKSAAIFAQADWNLSDEWKVTTGARLTNEKRNNVASSFIKSNGNALELNPDVVGAGAYAVNLGGFKTDQVFKNKDKSNNTNYGSLLPGNTPEQLALADLAAKKYFGASKTYATLTPGEKSQIADAKAIRAAEIGTVFPSTPAEAFKGNLKSFVLSPNYRVNDDISTYVSWQYGEKAGISQFVSGVSKLVKPEKTSAFELGAKTSLFNKTLVLNADIFLMDIKDYQQGVRVFDDYATASKNVGLTSADAGYDPQYASATGNAEKVRSQGLEIDGVYTGLPYTTIRFAGAYNDARYKKFANSAQPVENGYTGAPKYRDVSGQRLPGAARFTFNIGAEYRRPVWGNKEFHTDFNTAFTSSYKSDNSLSDYSVIPKNSITDLGIGLSTKNQAFDVTLLVKNAFDDDTPSIKTWNSYTPAVSRWYGVVFSGEL
jgi:iron complex outermembrane recepter protein